MEKLTELKEIIASEQDKACSLFEKNRKQYNITYGSWCFESILGWVMDVIDILMEEEESDV